MDFDLTEELQILRSTVRRFVDKELMLVASFCLRTV